MRPILLLLALITPLPAQACLDGSPVEGTLSPDLLMDRERNGFRAAFAQEMEILDSTGTPLADAFTFARCDLAGDTVPELLAFATGEPFCEGTCGVWALEQKDVIWEVVVAGEGEMRLAASSSMGRPDLIFSAPGAADSVHKFDGVMWRAVLDGLIYGESFVLPDTAGWQPDEAGFVGLAEGAPGPNGEAVIALEALRAQRGIDPNAVVTSLTSLNGDAVPEVVIEGMTPELCDAAGCTTWVIAVEGDAARILAETVAQGTLEIASSATDGWRDIIVWGDAGAAILQWNGDTYD